MYKPHFLRNVPFPRTRERLLFPPSSKRPSFCMSLHLVLIISHIFLICVHLCLVLPLAFLTNPPTFGWPTADHNTVHLFSLYFTPAQSFITNSVPSLSFFISPAHFQPSLCQHLQKFLTYSYRISPVPGPLFPIPSIPQISVPHNIFSHILP